MKPKPSKPATLRKGRNHKKPCYKPNAYEVERRITAVELLIARGARKTQIHAAMSKEFDLSWRTADEYAVRARERLIQRSQKTRDIMKSEALGLYESIFTDPESKPGDKIRARERIDELFGLNAPRRTELSGPDGGPVAVEDKTPPKIKPEVLRRIIAAAEPSTHETAPDTNGA